MLYTAISIAKKAFADKTDKAGKPYAGHLKRVAERISCDKHSCELKTIAWLHDLLEDCPEWTIAELKTFFPAIITSRVALLTRNANESYEEYIRKICTDKWASIVKKADLEDNMNLTRLPHLTEQDIERLKKYHSAYQQILAVLNKFDVHK